MRCIIPGDGDECPQSYVIRFKCPLATQPILREALKRYGRDGIVDHGFLAGATVFGIGFNDDCYFVVTTNEGQLLQNASITWKSRMKTVSCYDCRTGEIYKLPKIAYVDRFSHFDRSSQRLLGWGDAYATLEDVDAAVSQCNTDELLTLVLGAASLITRHELEHLPGIFVAMRSGGPPSPHGCRHYFFNETEETVSDVILGPCGVCGVLRTLHGVLLGPCVCKHEASVTSFPGTLLGPCAECGANAALHSAMLTKCSTCDEVRCKGCALRYGEGGLCPLSSFLRAYHEATDSHVMTPVRAPCDLCGKQPCNCGGKRCEECRAKVQTRGCICGITRCLQCLPL